MGSCFPYIFLSLSFSNLSSKIYQIYIVVSYMTILYYTLICIVISIVHICLICIDRIIRMSLFSIVNFCANIKMILATLLIFPLLLNRLLIKYIGPLEKRINLLMPSGVSLYFQQNIRMFSTKSFPLYPARFITQFLAPVNTPQTKQGCPSHYIDQTHK